MGKKRFSKSEMRGFLFLFALLLAGITFHYFRDLFFQKPTPIISLSDKEIRELKDFQEQIRQDSIQRERLFQARQRQSKKREKRIIQPFPFNPNTADSATLARIGLSDWQIENLLKYRRKGGKWKKPQDFARLYGLSDADFQQLLPYIRIPKDSAQMAKTMAKARRDSIHNQYPKKYEKGVVLFLNEVDTTALKGIPGIGSYYAQKICRYRERLGGFVSIDQLDEIEGLPTDIKDWFQLGQTTSVVPLPINQRSFKELLRHPYLNYEQVKAICNYVRKYGKITSWEELSNDPAFTAEDIQRLRPYISFR
ncbi:hypothetical protein EVA_22605 [gut metagenome]|uniref:Helix-hairpin-helix domain-containing protein n=1 Tax=gut metagenome TaxID=749906 RepID=J9BNX7_9ZZZZ